MDTDLEIKYAELEKELEKEFEKEEREAERKKAIWEREGLNDNPYTFGDVITYIGDGVNRRTIRTGVLKSGLDGQLFIESSPSEFVVRVGLKDFAILELMLADSIDFVDNAAKQLLAECVDGAKQDHEQFVADLAAINPDIEVLGVYRGITQEAYVRFKSCGHSWLISAFKLLHGTDHCPECSKFGE